MSIRNKRKSVNRIVSEICGKNIEKGLMSSKEKLKIMEY